MSNEKNMRFLKQAFLNTLKKNYFYAMILIIAVLAGSVINVWPSLVLRKIVDETLISGEKGLWGFAFMYLGALMLIGLSDLVREYGAMVFGQRMLLDIRILMLKRLRLLPISYYLEVPAGETISKFTSDIDAINTLFSAGLVSAVADLLKIIGLIVALIALSVPLGLIAIGALPIIYFLANYFRKNIYDKQLVVRKRVSDINTGIQEIFSGLKVVKAFGKERYFANRFEPTLENHRLAMNGNSIYDAWFPCIMQTLRAVVIATAIVIGASNNTTTFALALSLGTLAAAADLFIRLFDPIEAVASEIQTIQQAMAGINRIETFFKEKIETENKVEVLASEVNEVDIIINEVHFAYRKGKEVLKGTSVVIPAGTKAAIAGRTGSGKTTLMNLVAGLYPVGGGNITVGGVNPYILPPSERRRLIGIVPQTVHIFHGTIHDNISLRDESISRSQVEVALETVGILEVVKKLPNGLDTVIEEGISYLSFGQTQLLSLARAIVTNPPLLLLDELTSGLDAKTEKEVLEAIKKISDKRTIVTISHRLSGIIDADIVHIMDHGLIMESGSPEKLAEKEGWYAIYKRLENRGWQI